MSAIRRRSHRHAEHRISFDGRQLRRVRAMSTAGTCAALSLVLVAGCNRGVDPRQDSGGADGRVSQAELGDDWPLTVPSGEFGCAANRSITFTAPDGTTYAVDSSATTQHLPPFSAIWADDPTQRGGKKAIAAFMERGVAHCRS